MIKFEEKLVFTIFDCVIGALLVILAIFKYTHPMYYLRYLLATYYILYAALLICSNFLEIVRNWFNFLDSLYGKGGFLLYVGILCLDVYKGCPNDFYRVNCAFGFIFLFYGAFLIVYGVIKTIKGY